MSNEMQQVKNKINQLEAKIGNMQSSLHDILESVKNLQNGNNLYIKKSSNEDAPTSVSVDYLKYEYNNKPFSEFYKEIKDHVKWMNEHEDLIETDSDGWGPSCYDEENNPFARVLGCLLYFDAILVAHYIAAINRSDIVGTDNYIASAGINDINDISDWEKTLIDDLGQLVSFVIESGEATEKEPYKHWQVGRLHLTSSIVTYNYKGEDDTVRKLELYWTPESAEAGNLY